MGFANTRFPAEPDPMTLSVARLLPALSEQTHFLRPSDEWPYALRLYYLTAIQRVTPAQYLQQRFWERGILTWRNLHATAHKQALDQPRCCGTNHYGIGRD